MISSGKRNCYTTLCLGEMTFRCTENELVGKRERFSHTLPIAALIALEFAGILAALLQRSSAALVNLGLQSLLKSTQKIMLK